ncbi:tRNA epoxyqueuosine(34) reductase QueG [Carboxylicivirga sp. A043]|uniref:tRNA epoxyqueuosine(34) reductase QueG n=1 Tax=Carboxylicivirga litoralis TaxID=2816963 RepID=UPI0021CB160E|nr:tRNA epoxyqueuosine(34) reductase QueG [Carboxylicivirga sp. A043]MCU4156345.1 tRNA epoxyqueuosine(34) reductase QueG [Carboxylicivirga sp. A043]
MSIISQAYHQLIKDKAIELGFSDVGFALIEPIDNDEAQLKLWLDKGYQAGMTYMNNHFEKRVNPALLVEGAKSIISVLLNYKPKEEQLDTEAPKLARYAYGKDYHFVIKDKLQELFNFIKEEIYPSLEGRVFTDSAPVLDRAWAVKAGLGWVGKNTNLIHKKLGSFTLIGEIICNLELKPDKPIKEACGGCQRCIDACPTGALIGPYQLDANKCISYLTIEHRDELPEELRNQFNNWAFGCDICQEACPWNWKARPTKEEAFVPHPDLLSLSKDDWHNMDEEKFRELFRKSAVKRTKYSGLKRNLKFLK